MKEQEYHTYGAWRRPRDTGLMGATFGTTMLGIGAAAVVFLIGLFFGFGVAFVIAVPLALAFIPSSTRVTAAPATKGHS